MRPTRTLATALLALLASAAPGPARANDGSYGGNGVHPMPVKSREVRMVGEHVVLRLDPKRRAWTVTCEFYFENTTDRLVDVTLGFPFPVADEEGELSIPEGKKPPKPGQPLVWDFKTFVRGKPVKVRPTKTLTNPALPDVSYAFAYLWQATLKPRERVTIKNTYLQGETRVVDGTMQALYVLKTGSTWQGGKIGRSRLEVHVPDPRVVPCPPHMAHDGKWAQPAGHKLVDKGSGLTLKWDLKDFAPDQDLDVCFVDLDQALWMLLADLSTDDLSALDAEALRLKRNEVFAYYGYVFEDPKLRAHFAKQWWYRPDRTFAPSKMDRTHWELVERIKAEEAKRSGRP